MRRLAMVFAVSLGLAGIAGAQNLDFEAGHEGWAQVAGAMSAEQTAAQGKQSLGLAATGTEGAWAVSEVLPGVEPGKAFELSLSLRKVEGDGPVAVALVSEKGRPVRPYLWEGSVRADSRWHRLVLQVVTGLSSPRVALGVTGSGRWLVDDLRLRPVQVRDVTKPVAKKLRPQYAAELPQGWVPKGRLDLQTRNFLGRDSYYMRPGPFELNPQGEVTVLQGERTGGELDVLSRGKARNDLGVEVQGPPGWRSEVWSASIPGEVRVSLNVPLQAMTCGDSYLKVEFGAGGETKQMPLLVHSQRRFPLLGTWWPQGSSVDLAGKLDAGAIQFHEVVCASATDLKQAAGSFGQPGDVAIRWGGEVKSAVAALTDLPVQQRGRICAFGLEGEVSAADQQALAAALPGLIPEAAVLSPTVSVAAGQQGLQGGEKLQSLLAGGVGDSSEALDVQMPALPCSVVLRETLDGAAPTGPMASWTALDKALSLQGLRDQLNQAGAALPVYARFGTGTGTAAPGLDALVMTRALLQVFSVGASGVAVPAVQEKAGGLGLLDSEAQPVDAVSGTYAELCRELAGVRALAPPPDTEVAGYSGDKPVTYRPFLRGDEGIVALWNNSAQRKSVAVEVRCRPWQVRLLRISYPGETCQREFDGSFEWDELAKRFRQPAVYVDLEPLQTVVLSLKLRGAHAQWLREIGEKPIAPPPVNKMDMKEFDKEVWGPK